MKTHFAAWMLVVSTLSVDRVQSAEIYQASARTAGRASFASRTTTHPSTLWAGDGDCGCQSGGSSFGGCSTAGCSARGCSAPSCGVSSCVGVWDTDCAPRTGGCCPCILKRLAAGIGRTLDCIFTCNRCGNACGGGCAGSAVQTAHGCCLPGLISVRHQQGCASGGCTSGYQTKVHTSHVTPQTDSEIEFKASPIVEPGTTNPFIDDAENHRRIVPPNPPRDARKQPVPSRLATKAGSKKPAVVEVVNRDPAPRKISVKNTDSIKPLAKTDTRSMPTKMKAKDSVVVRKGSNSTRKPAVMAASATRTKGEPTPANPLRDE